MSEDIVISASLLRPGFCEDLSTWQVSIDQTGHLVLDLCISTSQNGYSDEKQRIESQIDQAEIQAILSFAKEIDFSKFPDSYNEGVDDVETVSIGVSIDDVFKSIEVEGLLFLAWQGNERMIHLSELWKKICRHIPFPEPCEDRREIPPPEPWYYRYSKLFFFVVIPTALLTIGLIKLSNILPKGLKTIGPPILLLLAVVILSHGSKFVEDRWRKRKQ
jgi:hypothetical protein